MSWNQTHRRWAALREIDALANAGCTELPWNAEYAELFGDRDALAAALEYRWNLARTTQLDSHLSESALEEQRRRLTERHAGVLQMLANHARGTSAVGTERTSGSSQPVRRVVDVERLSA